MKIEDLKELQMGAIAKTTILRELQRLEQKSNEAPLKAAEIGALEKLTKLYCALMDDLRKNIDTNIVEKLQKLSER